MAAEELALSAAITSLRVGKRAQSQPPPNASISSTLAVSLRESSHSGIVGRALLGDDSPAPAGVKELTSLDRAAREFGALLWGTAVCD